MNHWKTDLGIRTVEKGIRTLEAIADALQRLTDPPNPTPLEMLEAGPEITPRDLYIAGALAGSGEMIAGNDMPFEIAARACAIADAVNAKESNR